MMGACAEGGCDPGAPLGGPPPGGEEEDDVGIWNSCPAEWRGERLVRPPMGSVVWFITRY